MKNKKKKIEKSFDKGAENYEKNYELQRAIGKKLIKFFIN